MAICLVSISTLYFLEHSKPNDRQFQHFNNGFYSERSYLLNGSYVGAGMPGGGGGGFSGSNILSNENSWSDYYYFKKFNSNVKPPPPAPLPPQSPTNHNTQNTSLIVSAVSSQSVVELAPPNVGPSSLDAKLNNDKLDVDGQSKTTIAQHILPEGIEKHSDFEKSLHAILPSMNTTNISKQAKLAIGKYNNDVTTEKIQLKAEKIVDNYPSIQHETSNSIAEQPDNGFSEVDTNFIDVGHNQPPRNNGSTYCLPRISARLAFSNKVDKKFLFFILLLKVNQMMQIQSGVGTTMVTCAVYMHRVSWNENKKMEKNESISSSMTISFFFFSSWTNRLRADRGVSSRAQSAISNRSAGALWNERIKIESNNLSIIMCIGRRPWHEHSQSSVRFGGGAGGYRPRKCRNRNKHGLQATKDHHNQITSGGAKVQCHGCIDNSHRNLESFGDRTNHGKRQNWYEFTRTIASRWKNYNQSQQSDNSIGTTNWSGFNHIEYAIHRAASQLFG